MNNKIDYKFAFVLTTYPFIIHISNTAYMISFISGIISIYEIFKFFFNKKSINKNSLFFLFFSSLVIFQSLLNYSKFSSLIVLIYILIKSFYINIFFNNTNNRKILNTIDFIYKASICFTLFFMIFDIFYPQYQSFIGFRDDTNYPFLGSFSIFRAHGLFDEPSEISIFLATLIGIRIYICKTLDEMSTGIESLKTNNYIFSYIFIVFATVSTSALIYFLALVIIGNFKKLFNLYLSKKILLIFLILIPFIVLYFFPILLKLPDFVNESSSRSIFLFLRNLDLPTGQGIGFLSISGIYLPNLFVRLIIEQGIFISIIFYLMVIRRLFNNLYPITILFILFAITSGDIIQPIFSLFIAIPLLSKNKYHDPHMLKYKENY